MRAEFPDFRLGSVLATSFTATLTERRGDAVERIPTPQRLVDWLAVSGLAVDSCTAAQLDLARNCGRRFTPPRLRPRYTNLSPHPLSTSSMTAALRAGPQRS